MVRIDPNAFYTRADLVAMLKPLSMDADGLIAKIKPKKRFRLVWWGGDIIEAIEACPPINAPLADAQTPTRSKRTRRKRRGRRKETARSLIGGIFTSAEIGLDRTAALTESASPPRTVDEASRNDERATSPPGPLSGPVPAHGNPPGKGGI